MFIHLSTTTQGYFLRLIIRFEIIEKLHQDKVQF